MFHTLQFISNTATSVLRSLDRSQKTGLGLALLLMLIAGSLTNIPTIAIGSLVDLMFHDKSPVLSKAAPFLFVIAISIILREVLKIIHKYVVENTCTQLEKKTGSIPKPD